MKRRTKKELNEFAKGIGIQFPVGITKFDSNNAFVWLKAKRGYREKILIGYDWCKYLPDENLAATMFHEEGHLLFGLPVNVENVELKWMDELKSDIYSVKRIMDNGIDPENALFGDQGTYDLCAESHPSCRTRDNIMREAAEWFKMKKDVTFTVKYSVPDSYIPFSPRCLGWMRWFNYPKSLRWIGLHPIMMYRLHGFLSNVLHAIRGRGPHWFTIEVTVKDSEISFK